MCGAQFNWITYYVSKDVYPECKSTNYIYVSFDAFQQTAWNIYTYIRIYIYRSYVHCVNKWLFHGDIDHRRRRRRRHRIGYMLWKVCGGIRVVAERYNEFIQTLYVYVMAFLDIFSFTRCAWEYAKDGCTRITLPGGLDFNCINNVVLAGCFFLHGAKKCYWN